MRPNTHPLTHSLLLPYAPTPTPHLPCSCTPLLPRISPPCSDTPHLHHAPASVIYSKEGSYVFSLCMHLHCSSPR